MSHFPFFISIWLFLAGLFGVVSSRNFVHLVICISVLQSSSYVLLLSIGYRTGAPAPIFADIAVGTRAVDPVVQALMLTDVVVEVTVMAVLLALVVMVHDRTGELDPTRLGILRG